MDKAVVCRNSRNTVRTDLSLLLECLKSQMKCPDLQKQALLTINSICEKREDTVDILREVGGVAFLYNLSKSSIVHSDVKETALFTLGTLAEANVYCKNSLCRKEAFADVAGWLMKEDIPLTQKRVSVYLLSVLVANNKLGQTLAQTTGCLDILLDLFRSTFPLSTEATMRAANAIQTYQLWAAVSSALCGCVNNPQNEDGQRVCVATFPMMKTWLQQLAFPRAEIFQPICNFIAMTVANNSCVQESFSALGGLETLTLALVRQASAADTSVLSCQISLTIAKTLSACITHNSSLASGLAQYGVVAHLFSLLTSPHLDPEDRLSVLLTMSHCTVASEEHQSQVVQCGGLPLIITLLTDDASEEVRKAATFILHTCKQATMSFGVPDLTGRQEEGENVSSLTNMEGLRSSARELQRRIELLEKRREKDEQEDMGPAASEPGRPSVETGGDNSIRLQIVRDTNKTVSHELNNNLSKREEKAETSGSCKRSGAVMSSHEQSLEGSREPPTADSRFLKPPAPRVPKEMLNRKESQGVEMSTVQRPPAQGPSLCRERCAGCVLSFEEVTSRTFTSLQSSGTHSCDMHQVLLEATERFRARHSNLLLRRGNQDDTLQKADPGSDTVSAAEPPRRWKNWSEFCLTPLRKEAVKASSSFLKPHQREHTGSTLTLLHRGARKDALTSYHRTGPSLTPLKRSHPPEE